MYNRLWQACSVGAHQFQKFRFCKGPVVALTWLCWTSCFALVLHLQAARRSAAALEVQVAALSAAASAGQDEKQKALADAHEKVASLQREVSVGRQLWWTTCSVVSIAK
jgi:hypothetical protein